MNTLRSMQLKSFVSRQKRNLLLRKAEGFTLVEIVVVMTIIVVLATLVIGGINNARKQARDTQRINDLKSIDTAIIAYHIKKKEYPPHVVLEDQPLSTEQPIAYQRH